LHYLAGSELAYQFGISGVVYGTGPSTKVDYAPAPWVAALFNSGFTASLYVEPEGKAEDNLGGGVVGAGDVGKRKILGSSGGWGVLRSHVLRPGGNWLQFFAVLYFIKLFVDWLFNVVYRRLVGIYGPWRLRVVMGYVRSLFSSYFVYYNKHMVMGCHGKYGGSPGGFSPLEDCVDGAHYYEPGFDDVIPGWLAQVLDNMFSIFKVYVKTPEEIKEGNPDYYAKLLRELGEPPPMPREFADLVGSLMRLIA